MIEVTHPEELERFIGHETVGEWFTVDQTLIDDFAGVTGDHNWIHVDVERARRELPTRQTIAHGLLTLCLLPRLWEGELSIERLGVMLNYGIDRLRFTTMVPAGSRIRLKSTIRAVERRPDGGVRLTTERVVEVEGANKPAMVADTLLLLYPA